jgi:hypothetical protein
MTGSALVTITALASLNAVIEMVIGSNRLAISAVRTAAIIIFGEHAVRDIDVNEPSHRLSTPS